MRLFKKPTKVQTQTPRPPSTWTTEELLAYVYARRAQTPQALRALGHTGPATWACGNDCGRKGCCA